VLNGRLRWMLGDLGAPLIVFAVAHLVMVIVLACRPQAAQASVLLAAECASGAGCAVDARLVPGHLMAALAAAVVMVVVAGLYGRMSRWLHPAGAAVWASWLLLGAALLGWGGLFLAHLHVSRMTSSLLWAAAVLSAVTLPSAGCRPERAGSRCCAAGGGGPPGRRPPGGTPVCRGFRCMCPATPSRRTS
jgi:hypothetical protein